MTAIKDPLLLQFEEPTLLSQGLVNYLDGTVLYMLPPPMALDSRAIINEPLADTSVRFIPMRLTLPGYPGHHDPTLEGFEYDQITLRILEAGGQSDEGETLYKARVTKTQWWSDGASLMKELLLAKEVVLVQLNRSLPQNYNWLMAVK